MELHDGLHLNLAQFNDLVTNHRLRFVRFAFTYTQDEDAAEDAVMEAFMSLWEKRTELPSDTNVMSYVLTSVKNKALNYLKHKAVVEQTAETMKSSGAWELQTRISTLTAFEPDNLYSKEIMQIVRETLKELSPTSRRIFLLSRVSGRSYKEIAEEMGMTEKGVEFHIGRVLKALRGTLKEYMGVFLWMLLLWPEKFGDML